MTDWFTELMFNVRLNTKEIILETLFPANLMSSSEKIKIRAGRKELYNTINLG